MLDQLTRMVEAFEEGRLTGRELVVGLGTLVTAVAGAGRAVGAEPEAAKSTFKTKALNHLALSVKDVAQSRDWYRSTSGSASSGKVNRTASRAPETISWPCSSPTKRPWTIIRRSIPS